VALRLLRRLIPRIVEAAWLGCALALSLPVAAHETDQYTLPAGRDFADLGPYLTRIVHGALVDAVARTNVAIESAIDHGASAAELADLQSADYIAGMVWASMFAALPTNELLDIELLSEPVRAQYPGLITMYRAPVALYDDPLLVVDLTKFVRTFFRAGTISAGGVEFGTDKLIHFINVGRIYHSKYEARVARGMPRDAAIRSAIDSTSRNRLTSEDGMLGMWTTGIYSNGDLAADYAGLQFYRNLTETVRVGPRTLPPMLERDGAGWRVKVGAESDFFVAFITPHWNEVLNPNRYLGYPMDRLQTLVAERCADAVDWYRDPHGRRRTRQDFEAIERELSTYFGEDYGHKSNQGRKLTIASVCFADGTTTAPAPAADHPQPAGATTAEVDRFGRGALWWAARAGDGGQVRQLAAAGADVNAADIDGETPLHAAARSGSAAATRELVARGANPNRPALYGVAPLMLAAAGGRTEVGVELLRAGADPNARDLFGRAALHESARRGDLELARALLDHGAQPLLADDAGSNAMDLAKRQRREAMVALLQRHATSAPARVTAAPGSDGAAPAPADVATPEAAETECVAGRGDSAALPAAALAGSVCERH
jgi:ankyrin repeat protein